jgi:chromosome segregation ATPase
MSAELVTLLVAVLGSGVIGGIVTSLFNRRKVSAEADSIAHENERKGYTELLTQYQTMVSTQTTEVERLDALVTKLSGELRHIQTDLAKMRTTHLNEQRQFVTQINALQDKVRALESQNRALKKRIAELEEK